jgi:hypothetical protein
MWMPETFKYRSNTAQNLGMAIRFPITLSGLVLPCPVSPSEKIRDNVIGFWIALSGFTFGENAR